MTDEQKELTLQMERDRERLNYVIAGISHDFRTPLTASYGYMQMVKKSGELSENSTAGQAIGYKELIDVIKGEKSLEVAADQIKQFSRNYAKRQLTWFSAKPYVQWITANEGKTARKSEEIVNNALELSMSAWNML